MKAVENVLTIDLEEWFHVTNFSRCIARDEWSSLPTRVEYTVPRLLDMFEQYNAKATFFILGWVASRFPELVRRISDAGHEIASHGDEHRLITDQSPEEFRDQLLRSKDVLEQISGEPVHGHRAPSYSMRKRTNWAVEILLETGFLYDSSVFAFGPRRDEEFCTSLKPCLLNGNGHGNLVEYPLSMATFAGCTIPIAGGGYFRFLPYEVVKWGVDHLNREEHRVIMYFHPWEIDPQQPRVHKASWLARFRHYHQLEQTESKLRRLLADFRFGSIRDVFWCVENERYETEPVRREADLAEARA